MDNKNTLIIKPNSKRNGLFLLTLGLILMLICFMLNLAYWHLFKLQLTALMLASFIVVLIGYFKHSEPSISYKITPQTITYYHRRGKWQINWSDIIRVGVISSEIQGERVRLPYIGIKLTSLEPLATTVTPRLANKLLHEQQELCKLAVQNSQLTIAQAAIHFDGFKTKGSLLKGPVGAWLHQSKNLNLAYGYHVYLPEGSFDRDTDQFVGLLKQCHAYSSQYTKSIE
ncbi:DUF2982 domain-containing protein [Thalassotalea nanhaiensis]|uniref:DUF2982 domain-containing protein n=1 Tax=Thalassotalea nanhaiensis TaxID=3065648 RepID=A0ABY9TR24_9GAMM|nr:DUF2982 domain-containing protein [Colwelliaceae bacterium SQ345]